MPSPHSFVMIHGTSPAIAHAQVLWDTGYSESTISPELVALANLTVYKGKQVTTSDIGGHKITHDEYVDLSMTDGFSTFHVSGVHIGSTGLSPLLVMGANSMSALGAYLDVTHGFVRSGDNVLRIYMENPLMEMIANDEWDNVLTLTRSIYTQAAFDDLVAPGIMNLVNYPEYMRVVVLSLPDEYFEDYGELLFETYIWSDLLEIMMAAHTRLGGRPFTPDDVVAIATEFSNKFTRGEIVDGKSLYDIIERYMAKLEGRKIQRKKNSP